ncbi:MAG: hypothetical protein GX288_07805 [Clostridiales bacterium]|nr:hypothetical protein [Clostridiales bacterium]
MIKLLMVLLWLVFIVMTVSQLFYLQYRDKQILGITFSKAHSMEEDVTRVVASCRKVCLGILFLSVGFSLIMLIPALQEYGEFIMLFLIICNIFSNGFIIRYYQKKLLTIKKVNDWEYSRNNLITIDLNVSREKGKASISAFWVWLFFLLSFIPTVILLVNPKMRQTYPLALSFIGPFSQLCASLVYYQLKNLPTKLPNINPELRLIYAHKQERINSITGTLSALSMLIFWCLFNISILYTNSSIPIIAPVIILVVGLLGIAHWQQKKLRSLEDTFAGTISDVNEELYEEEPKWKWGFYHNPKDPRILVPKRLSGMGWTFNTGHPVGRALSLAILLVLFFILGVVFYGSGKDYQFTVKDSELIIDAAMYDMTIDKDQIASVSIISTLPKGIRTNGYGGIRKSYGNFQINDYGPCKLYIYNDLGKFIVLELTTTTPSYVIINKKTLEDTEALYFDINNWISK